MIADVVGSSRLMEIDEAGTLAAIRNRWDTIVEPVVHEHEGRIVKYMGDGFLAEFASAVNAVACALAVQEKMRSAPDSAAAIALRIGINLGDVVVHNGDVFGDGVNVAARLEDLAEPGGICISAKVYNEVNHKVAGVFTDIGSQRLKNLAAPVQVYRSVTPGACAPAALALPDRPSIAVLPFRNMSGDAEQEYFADGVVEEIITALSRFHWLFVIARNSSFVYKGHAVDVKQVGRDLGVRYVLDGSIRRAGTRVRITGELVDTHSGSHLWADRFEANLHDIFELQDQLTASVVGAMAPKLEWAEIERSRRKATHSLDAYDYYLRGMAAYHRWSIDTSLEALEMFRRAIGLDPQYAAAYAMAARCHVQAKAAGGRTLDFKQASDEAGDLARRAAALGADDAFCVGTAGFALGWMNGEVEYSHNLTQEALRLNPNFAWGWLYSGWANVWIGDHRTAAEHLHRALQLSPQDPHTISMNTAMACAFLFSGKPDEAWPLVERVVQRHPSYGFPNCVGAASAALIGHAAQAGDCIARVRELFSWLCLSNIDTLMPLRRLQDRRLFAEGLKLAGLVD